MDTTEKQTKIFARIFVVLLVLGITIIIYAGLSCYQQYRYDIKDYNCAHMSADCKDFFEHMGINTTTMHGERTLENGTIKRHCWLRLNLGIFGTHEFESTSLIFKNVSKKYDYVHE